VRFEPRQPCAQRFIPLPCLELAIARLKLLFPCLELTPLGLEGALLGPERALLRLALAVVRLLEPGLHLFASRRRLTDLSQGGIEIRLSLVSLSLGLDQPSICLTNLGLGLTDLKFRFRHPGLRSLRLGLGLGELSLGGIPLLESQGLDRTGVALQTGPVDPGIPRELRVTEE
jgi:hypothetical protein